MQLAPKAMPTADIDEIDAKLERRLQRREGRGSRRREGTGRVGEDANSG